MDTHIIEIKRAILIHTTYNTGSQIIYHTETMVQPSIFIQSCTLIR